MKDGKHDKVCACVCVRLCSVRACVPLTVDVGQVELDGVEGFASTVSVCVRWLPRVDTQTVGKVRLTQDAAALPAVHS